MCTLYFAYVKTLLQNKTRITNQRQNFPCLALEYLMFLVKQAKATCYIIQQVSLECQAILYYPTYCCHQPVMTHSTCLESLMLYSNALFYLQKCFVYAIKARINRVFVKKEHKLQSKSPLSPAKQHRFLFLETPKRIISSARDRFF